MKINKRLRVVILTILISILMTIISPLGQCVCYADDDKFAVSFSVPKWEYDEFYYSSVDVTTKGDSTVKNITVHVEDGYIVTLPSKATSSGPDLTWVTDDLRNDDKSC